MIKKSTTNLAIVVLNWNGISDTLSCIRSISGFDSHIIVVDNGSLAAEVDEINKSTSSLENVSLILCESNLGFAGGVNIGIKHAIKAGYNYVALLNNDAVADRNWATELVNALEADPSLSIATGLLLNESGKNIDSTGEQYSTWGMPFPRNRGDRVAAAPESGYVFGATGGATLYRTSLFKEIGLFDESFFAYYEDVDISFRAQLAGHKVYYTNKAIAYHKQGATSSKIPGFTVYQTFKNIPLLYTKNVPAGLLLPIGARLFLLYGLIFANAVKNGSGVYALKGWLASIWYFWTKSLWLRIGIQRNKTVTTQYINSIILHDLSPDQTGMRRFRKFFTGK
jgi:GT2 family glycosyltransferase